MTSQFQATVDKFNKIADNHADELDDISIALFLALFTPKIPDVLDTKIIGLRVKEVEKELGHKISIDDSKIKELIKMSNDGIRSLHSDLINKLKRTLYQDRITGAKNSQILKHIKIDVKKFGKKADVYFNTARHQILQRTEDTIAKAIRYIGAWEYVGAPLVNNSHLECIWAYQNRVNRIFTTKEKDDFIAGIGAFPHSIPRWNCRHWFVMKKIKEVLK